MSKDSLFTITNIVLERLNDHNLDEQSCSEKCTIVNFFHTYLSFLSEGWTSNSDTQVMKVLEVSLLLLNEARLQYMADFILNDLVDLDDLDTIHTLVFLLLDFFWTTIMTNGNKKFFTKYMSELTQMLLFYS